MAVDPVVLERVATERGELVLRRAGAHFEVISNGTFLMDTRDGRSERLLVKAALDRHPNPRRVLVGGLGVGFSVQEALADPRPVAVTVAEIEPAVVRWHATHLSEISDRVLDDRRTVLFDGDVAALLTRSGHRYDVICLDVDNGPEWTVTAGNRRLYDDAGTRLLVSRLRTGGVLSVWAAAASPDYLRLMRRHLEHVVVLEVPVPRGAPDVVMVGSRPGTG